jgi:hypothetical protein
MSSGAQFSGLQDLQQSQNFDESSFPATAMTSLPASTSSSMTSLPPPPPYEAAQYYSSKISSTLNLKSQRPFAHQVNESEAWDRCYDF